MRFAFTAAVTARPSTWCAPTSEDVPASGSSWCMRRRARASSKGASTIARPSLILRFFAPALLCVQLEWDQPFLSKRSPLYTQVAR